MLCYKEMMDERYLKFHGIWRLESEQIGAEIVLSGQLVATCKALPLNRRFQIGPVHSADE